jgi:hypothetical protein
MGVRMVVQALTQLVPSPHTSQHITSMNIRSMFDGLVCRRRFRHMNDGGRPATAALPLATPLPCCRRRQCRALTKLPPPPPNWPPRQRRALTKLPSPPPSWPPRFRRPILIVDAVIVSVSSGRGGGGRTMWDFLNWVRPHRRRWGTADAGRRRRRWGAGGRRAAAVRVFTTATAMVRRRDPARISGGGRWP